MNNKKKTSKKKIDWNGRKNALCSIKPWFGWLRSNWSMGVPMQIYRCDNKMTWHTRVKLEKRVATLMKIKKNVRQIIIIVAMHTQHTINTLIIRMGERFVFLSSMFIIIIHYWYSTVKVVNFGMDVFLHIFFPSSVFASRHTYTFNINIRVSNKRDHTHFATCMEREREKDYLLSTNENMPMNYQDAMYVMLICCNIIQIVDVFWSERRKRPTYTRT